MTNANETPNEPIRPAADETSLSDIDRAAIVLLSMGPEAASQVLRFLSREELLEVTRVMSRMNGVKVDAADEALKSFFDAFREQSSVRGASRAFLKRSLDMALGSAVANSVLNSIYGDVIGPKMARLQWAQPRWLAERLSREHVRIQAIFLAFLPANQAGKVIHELRDAQRDAVLVQMSRLKEIDHDLLRELEQVADAYAESMETQSTPLEGVRQVAEIINHLPANRAEVVELLRAHDPDATSLIESHIYSFDILGHQGDETIAAALEAVSLDEWAIALKGSDPALSRALMRAMPQRQVQSFEETLRHAPPMPLSRIEQSRKEIMDRLREMAADGEIELRLVAEDVV